MPNNNNHVNIHMISFLMLNFLYMDRLVGMDMMTNQMSIYG